MPHAAPRRVPLAALALAAAACADPSAPVTPAADAPAPAARVAGPSDAAAQPIADQYIVVFRDDVGDVPGLARRLGGAGLRHTYRAAVKGFSARMSAQAAAALARNPNVALVEQDQVMSVVATTQTGATWGLDRIDQRALPLSTTYTYARDGAGVHAYIVDTGIRLSHGEFAGRLAGGYDAIASGGAAADCNGHGTHVAGTVGGTVHGVAKRVTLHPVRVLDCNGSGTTSGVIAGVDWVAANHVKPAVANMSLGGGASSSLDAAVQNAIGRGVTFVVAAGNGDRLGRQLDACTTSPARVGAAITIGATDRTDTKASWSNYGSCVDFFAPGVGITSAWYQSDGQTNTISGTSMAAPHVAGAAALHLQANAGASPQAVRDALYAATSKGIVKSSSTANNHLLYVGSTTATEPPPPTEPEPPPPTCNKPNPKACK